MKATYLALIFTTLVSVLLAVRPAAISASELVIPDEATVQVQCKRENSFLVDELSMHPGLATTVSTLRFMLGQLCSSFYMARISGDSWIAQFDLLDYNARRQLASSQTKYETTKVQSVPAGMTSYSTLLLPNRFKTDTVTDGALSQIISAFRSFSQKAAAGYAGIIFVKENNQVDLDLSTLECKQLFELPYCGNRVFLVTTKTRPDVWAKANHDPEAMVFDLTLLSDKDVTCFLKLSSQDPNVDLANSANIVATLRAVANKVAVPKSAVDKVETSAGLPGEIAFYVVDRLLGVLPCGSSPE
jgi:hypothetical protein